MKHRWAALMCVLALSALMPRGVAGQSVGRAGRDRAQGLELGQNYPNPFNPETKIPFSVGDAPECTESSRTHRVSLRIYNLLAQLVAIPLLQGGTAGVAGGQPIQNLNLPCGQYTAFWDGKYLESGNEVASGVYLYRLEVDDRTAVKRMFVAK